MTKAKRERAVSRELPDADIRELTGLLYAATSRFQVLRRTFASSIGLTSAEFAVVMSLHSLDATRGIRIRELADRLHVAAANCTATVKKLEKKKWVSKLLDPDDSRALSVQLTPASRLRLDNFFLTIHPVNEVWFSQVTKEDRHAVKKSLSRLIDQYPAALQVARAIKR